MNTHKIQYSTFSIPRQNLKSLRLLRPSFYYDFSEIEEDNHEMSYHVIKGNLLSDSDINKRSQIIQSNDLIITAINTSLILNATAYFEGALESFLLRRLENIFPISKNTSSLNNSLRNEIIRLSSIRGLKEYFKKLFGISLNEILKKDDKSLEFIEKFYHIRHHLTHASEIETVLVDKGGNFGAVEILHTTSSHEKLLSCLKDRYKQKEIHGLDLKQLLKFSKIIDDFSNSIELVIKNLAFEIKNQELFIQNKIYWDEFC